MYGVLGCTGFVEVNGMAVNAYLFTYLLTYLVHGAESFLRS